MDADSVGSAFLGAGVALEADAPSHWQRAAELPLLVVVGVTGVGKSTTLQQLVQRLRCFVLPDRRELADRVVIPVVQGELGQPPGPVRDRVERFRLTALYREHHPGGIAEALSLLHVDPALLGGPLVFDGLRGTAEIRWAIDHLPRTRFLALHAPEPLRLVRLLGRDQGFDVASVPGPLEAGGSEIESLYAAVPGLEAVLPPDDLAALLRSPALAGVELGQVAQKAAILVEEARNYDPAATLRMLDAELGPYRRLIVNTATSGPEAVADSVARWLQ